MKHSPSISTSTISRVWIWPVALLLCAQVLIYVALAPRGFELTDEAFYLLNGMYWRDFSALYSLFGAFLSPLMQISGNNLIAMRLVTLLALLASGSVLGWALWRHTDEQRGQRFQVSLYCLVGAAGGLYFFGVLSTLRVPSYNIVALSAAALATACLLRGIDAGSVRQRISWAIAYGFIMGACGLSKGSTGLLVGCVHLAYFALNYRKWDGRALLQLIAGVTVGLAVQLAFMTLAHPHWLAVLRAGATLFAYDNGGKLLGMVNEFRWDIQRLLRWSPLAFIGLFGWAWLLRYLRKQGKDMLPGWLALALTAAVAAIWLVKDWVQYWWAAALLLAIALVLTQVMARPDARLDQGERAEFKLWFLLFSLPLAFSFGTNMPVLWHSQVATLFVVLLIAVRIERLWQHGRLNAAMAGLALGLLCVPPLVFQLRAAFDASSTYRLENSLIKQDIPIRTPVGTVWVDTDTAQALKGLDDAATRAGLPGGAPVLDFTGDGPGLILALGGHPVGVPWLVGGYPNSGKWAERLVQDLPASQVAAAWILSSPDNPRAIPGWAGIMQQKLGPRSHALVASTTVRAPSHWGPKGPSKATLCLWRPLDPRHPEAVAPPSLPASDPCMRAPEPVAGQDNAATAQGQ